MEDAEDAAAPSEISNELKFYLKFRHITTVIIQSANWY